VVPLKGMAREVEDRKRSALERMNNEEQDIFRFQFWYRR